MTFKEKVKNQICQNILSGGGLKKDRIQDLINQQFPDDDIGDISDLLRELSEDQRVYYEAPKWHTLPELVLPQKSETSDNSDGLTDRQVVEIFSKIGYDIIKPRWGQTSADALREIHAAIIEVQS